MSIYRIFLAIAVTGATYTVITAASAFKSVEKERKADVYRMQAAAPTHSFLDWFSCSQKERHSLLGWMFRECHKTITEGHDAPTQRERLCTALIMLALHADITTPETVHERAATHYLHGKLNATLISRNEEAVLAVYSRAVPTISSRLTDYLLNGPRPFATVGQMDDYLNNYPYRKRLPQKARAHSEKKAATPTPKKQQR